MQASGASMSDKLWQWVPLSILCAALGLLLHFVPVHDPRPFGGNHRNSSLIQFKLIQFNLM